MEGCHNLVILWVSKNYAGPYYMRDSDMDHYFQFQSGRGFWDGWSSFEFRSSLTGGVHLRIEVFRRQLYVGILQVLE